MVRSSVLLGKVSKLTRRITLLTNGLIISRRRLPPILGGESWKGESQSERERKGGTEESLYESLGWGKSPCFWLSLD